MSIHRTKLLLKLLSFIPFSLFFIIGCADIQSLTGGEEDEQAPRVIESKQTPSQGATSVVSTNELKITFDEYFTLNTPSKTIRMNPEAGKISWEQKNKQFIVRWENDLKENTTYLIELNKTIQDLNAKNDSIYNFVFSTGVFIDSAKLSGVLVDAQTNKPLNLHTISVFKEKENWWKDQAIYRSQTANNGTFNMQYIAQGFYRVIGFKDNNLNGSWDENEAYAFTSESLEIKDSTQISLHLFPSEKSKERLIAENAENGLLSISGKDCSKSTINDKPLTILNTFSLDSVVVMYPKNDKKLVIISPFDTVTKTPSITFKNLIPFKNKQVVLSGNSLAIEFKSVISNIDTSKIKLERPTGELISVNLTSDKNSLKIPALTLKKGDYKLKFKQNSLFYDSISNQDSLEILIQVLEKNDVCDLKFDLKNFSSSCVVQLYEGKELISQAKVDATFGEQSVLFSSMLPKAYTVHVLEDKNQDGQFSVGNVFENRAGETVHFYTLNQKLKAGWNYQQSLEP